MILVCLVLLVFKGEGNTTSYKVCKILVQHESSVLIDYFHFIF